MIHRFLLAVATALLLTACAKEATKPQPEEAEADTAAVELHFHAIAGLTATDVGESWRRIGRTRRTANAVGVSNGNEPLRLNLSVAYICMHTQAS